MGRGKERLSGWDGNVVELGCHDGCTTINIIKFIDLKNVYISGIQHNVSTYKFIVKDYYKLINIKLCVLEGW